ncbi:hypothetical protein K474DRAFT_1655075 [Panus rudis PR-1116 ss-1]|nr:hypothetical protein K474DRAFT_1655075 [Panus rudis PR-1116 ss-1]
MPHVVILGSGIIGLSTAYYLAHLSSSSDPAQPPNTQPDEVTLAPHNDTSLHQPSPSSESSSASTVHIHLVDPSPTLFASASGHAAGFLAKDWFSPSVAALGEFSFELHKRLAEEWGGKERWGWAESIGWSLDRASDEESEESLTSAAPVVETASDSQQPERPPGALEKTNGAESSGSGTISLSGGEEVTHTASEPRTDLSWLMSGSSRTTVVHDPQPMQTTAETELVEDATELPHWLRVDRTGLQMIADRSSVAQIDPLRLCEFLLQRCQAMGVIVHHPARATALIRTDPNDPNSQTLIRIQVSGPDEERREHGNEGDEHTGEHRIQASDLLRGNTSSSTTAATYDATESGFRRELSETFVNPPQSTSETGSGGGASINSSQYFGSAGTSFESSQSWSERSASATRNAGISSSHQPIPPLGSFTSSEPSPRSDEPGLGVLRASARQQRRVLDIPCDSIVIAAGCWTPRVYRTLFPNATRIPRVSSLAGHSVVLKSRHWPPPPLEPRPAQPATLTEHRRVSSTRQGRELDDEGERPSADITPEADIIPNLCHAIFTSDQSGFSPEVFSRAHGDIWLGGLNSSTLRLPTLATDARNMISRTAINTLKGVARRLCGHDIQFVREGLCFRPVSPTGKPIIAKVDGEDLGDEVGLVGGVFVATGHGPWGISLSLGTGHVVAEMVLGRDPSADVSALGLRYSND